MGPLGCGQVAVTEESAKSSCAHAVARQHLKVCVTGNGALAAIIRSQRITGLTPDVMAELLTEICVWCGKPHHTTLTVRPRRRVVGVSTAAMST